MESTDIIKKYAYYLDAINTLGQRNLEDKTVRNLNLKRGNVTKAYDEMKEANFKGSLQGYISYIATSYLFYLLELIDPGYAKLPDKKFEQLLERLCDTHLNTAFCVVLFRKYQKDMFETFMIMKLKSNRKRINEMLKYIANRQTLNIDYLEIAVNKNNQDKSSS